jgi:hypothetical protein
MQLNRFNPRLSASYCEAKELADGNQPLIGNVKVLVGGRTVRGEVVIHGDGCSIDCEDQSWFMPRSAPLFAEFCLWLTCEYVSDSPIGAYILNKFGFQKI